MFNVFIGYDPRQPIAFQTLAHSIWNHASKPVNITRLVLNQLPIIRRGLTEFTYSRFLVPYLSDYKGYSLFMDSDVICRGDVCKIMEEVDQQEEEVFVSKNKLRFEWASVMLFNNVLCTELTPTYVEDRTNQLFDFKWACEVGDLNPKWNHLVGYDLPNPEAQLVHFTQGIPIWPETKGIEYSKEYAQVLSHANSSVSFKELMGNSVHAKHVYERLKHEGKC